jgi:hypothetical protein
MIKLFEPLFDPVIAGGQRFGIFAAGKAVQFQEEAMSVDTSQGNKNMDYAAHEQTYNLFITLVKYGTAACILLLLGMAMFLV